MISIFSTKFAYTLLHIKSIGKQMPISYNFMGWDVVDEFYVIRWSLHCLLFFFCYGFIFVAFLIFSINLPISSLNSLILCQRFEFRCSTPASELSFERIVKRQFFYVTFRQFYFLLINCYSATILIIIRVIWDSFIYFFGRIKTCVVNNCYSFITNSAIKNINFYILSSIQCKCGTKGL